jgi:TRAP-type C4-dicarboxylate transport system substrate-binding protein
LKRILLACMTIVVVVSLVIGGCAKPAPEEARELKFTGLCPPVSTCADQVAQFVSDVEEYTNGAVTIHVYMPGEIADVKDYPELCKRGDIEVIGAPPGYYPAIFPLNEQFMCYRPLFKGPDVAYYVWQGLLEEIPEVAGEFENQNMKYLCRYSMSVTYVISKKPIQNIADLQGLRLRASGGAYVSDLLEAAGAVPVQVESAEQYEAFLRGSIDGTLNDLGGLYDFDLYEIGKYIGVPFGSTPAWTLQINLDVWNSFSPDIQQAFERASKNFDEASLEEALAAEAHYRELLEAEGCQFVEFDQNDWQTMLEQAGDPLECFKLQMSEKGLQELGERVAPVWARLVEEGEEKYGYR